ncbi:MAG TPA: ABC transporter substrate-binding protein, partial [Candidatus Methylomirabilis sp.]
MRLRRAWGAGILAGAVVAAAAPALAADVVRLGDNYTLSSAPLFVAIEKGYLKDQGIDLVAERFAAAAKMNSALAGGELDVGIGTPSAGHFNAVAQGFDIKIVADKGQFRPGYAYTKLMARKDLVDAGTIRGPRDLKGRRVAAFAKGIIQDYEVGKILEQEGLAYRDVEMAYMAPPTIIQALAAKALDAAMLVEPWVAKAVGDGLAVPVADMERVPALRSHQAAFIIYAGKFIRERRPVAQRFMNAYLRGIEYVGKRGWQDDDLVDILVRYTKVEKPLVKRAVPPYIDADGRPDVPSLARFQDWLHEQGFVPEKVPME